MRWELGTLRTYICSSLTSICPSFILCHSAFQEKRFFQILWILFLILRCVKFVSSSHSSALSCFFVVFIVAAPNLARLTEKARLPTICSIAAQPRCCGNIDAHSRNKFYRRHFYDLVEICLERIQANNRKGGSWLVVLAYPFQGEMLPCGGSALFYSDRVYI